MPVQVFLVGSVVLDPLLLVQQPGRLPITAFTVFVLVTAPMLLAAMRDRRQPA